MGRPEATLRLQSRWSWIHQLWWRVFGEKSQENLVESGSLRNPGRQYVQMNFTDLDLTFFPGVKESEYDKEETERAIRESYVARGKPESLANHVIKQAARENKLGFALNLSYADLLSEKYGIPTVPATGNNLSMAQTKFSLKDENGDFLWDLQQKPGIYANGAMVIGGEDGKMIRFASLKDIKANSAKDGVSYLKEFQEAWVKIVADDEGETDPADSMSLSKISVGGICKWDTVLFNPQKERGGRDLIDDPTLPGVQWMIGLKQFYDSGGKLHWKDTGSIMPKHGAAALFEQAYPQAMRKNSLKQDEIPLKVGKEVGTTELAENHILGLQIIFPKQGDQVDQALVEKVETKLGERGLLSKGRFDIEAKMNGNELGIVKFGVNKGTAISEYLAPKHVAASANDSGSLGEDERFAVFGDAANDIELFGKDPVTQKPLKFQGGHSFRPAHRTSMPWACHKLAEDATYRGMRVHEVLKLVAEDRAVQLPSLLHSKAVEVPSHVHAKAVELPSCVKWVEDLQSGTERPMDEPEALIDDFKRFLTEGSFAKALERREEARLRKASDDSSATFKRLYTVELEKQKNAGVGYVVYGGSGRDKNGVGNMFVNLLEDVGIPHVTLSGSKPPARDTSHRKAEYFEDAVRLGKLAASIFEAFQKLHDDAESYEGKGVKHIFFFDAFAIYPDVVSMADVRKTLGQYRDERMEVYKGLKRYKDNFDDSKFTWWLSASTHATNIPEPAKSPDSKNAIYDKWHGPGHSFPFIGHKNFAYALAKLCADASNAKFHNTVRFIGHYDWKLAECDDLFAVAEKMYQEAFDKGSGGNKFGLQQFEKIFKREWKAPKLWKKLESLQNQVFYENTNLLNADESDREGNLRYGRKRYVPYKISVVITSMHLNKITPGSFKEWPAKVDGYVEKGWLQTAGSVIHGMLTMKWELQPGPSGTEALAKANKPGQLGSGEDGLKSTEFEVASESVLNDLSRRRLAKQQSDACRIEFLSPRIATGNS